MCKTVTEIFPLQYVHHNMWLTATWLEGEDSKSQANGSGWEYLLDPK